MEQTTYKLNNIDLEQEAQHPLVSIIIPVYNTAHTLDYCLESVFSQSFTRYEVIIVDDGSTDSSKEKCDEIARTDPRVRVIHKQNGGLASARNAAFDSVRGTYMTFLDADDYYDRDYLHVLVTKAEADGLDMVCSGQHKVTEDGRILKTIKYRIIDGQCLQRRLNISGKLYRTEYINKWRIRFPEGKDYEDNSFNLQAMFLSDKVGFIEYEGYYQVVHEGSITSKPIDPERLPYEEWRNVVKLVKSNATDRDATELFDFTFMSLLTYLLMVRCRKREYLSNSKTKKSVDGIQSISRRFQSIVNELLPDFKTNRYRKLISSARLPLAQKAGTSLFFCLCKYHLLVPLMRII